MDVTESQLSDGNAVDECPAPPSYYTLFSSQIVEPPLLSDIPNITNWSSGHQYNGAISSQINNQEVAVVANEEYRISMERFDSNNARLIFLHQTVEVITYRFATSHAVP